MILFESSVFKLALDSNSFDLSFTNMEKLLTLPNLLAFLPVFIGCIFLRYVYVMDSGYEYLDEHWVDRRAGSEGLDLLVDRVLVGQSLLSSGSGLISEKDITYDLISILKEIERINKIKSASIDGQLKCILFGIRRYEDYLGSVICLAHGNSGCKPNPFAQSSEVSEAYFQLDRLEFNLDRDSGEYEKLFGYKLFTEKRKEVGLFRALPPLLLDRLRMIVSYRALFPGCKVWKGWNWVYHPLNYHDLVLLQLRYTVLQLRSDLTENFYQDRPISHTILAPVFGLVLVWFLLFVSGASWVLYVWSMVCIGSIWGILYQASSFLSCPHYFRWARVTIINRFALMMVGAWNLFGISSISDLKEFYGFDGLITGFMCLFSLVSVLKLEFNYKTAESYLEIWCDLKSCTEKVPGVY